MNKNFSHQSCQLNSSVQPGSYIICKSEKNFKILDWEIFHNVLKWGREWRGCLQLVCFAKLDCHWNFLPQTGHSNLRVSECMAMCFFQKHFFKAFLSTCVISIFLIFHGVYFIMPIIFLLAFVYPIAPGVPTPDFEICMCITVVIQLIFKQKPIAANSAMKSWTFVS